MHFDLTLNSPAKALATALITFSSLSACTGNAAGPQQNLLPLVQVRVGQHSISAELADNDLARQIGLMNRKSLAADKGMLFVFQNSQTQCMWMKNTLIDLDVAFADEAGRILNIEQMKAGTTDIHCSRGDAKTALEMNINWFSEKKVGVGQVLMAVQPAIQKP